MGRRHVLGSQDFNAGNAIAACFMRNMLLMMLSLESRNVASNLDDSQS